MIHFRRYPLSLVHVRRYGCIMGVCCTVLISRLGSIGIRAL